MNKIDNRAVTAAMIAAGLGSSKGDELNHEDMGKLQGYAYFKGYSAQAFAMGMANDRDNTLIALFPDLASPKLVAAKAKEAADLQAAADKEAAEAQDAQDKADQEAAEAQAAQAEADAADAEESTEAAAEETTETPKKKSKK